MAARSRSRRAGKATPPPAPASPPAKRHARRDGWENAYTGVGTDLDKRSGGSFGTAPRLTDQEIDELVRGDDMAAKIVNKPANDMLRAGFEVTIEAPKKPAKQPLADVEAAPIGVEGDDSGDTEADTTAPKAPAAKADGFPPGKGGAPFGAPPPPEKPPGVIAPPDDATQQQSRDLTAALEELEVADKFAEALRAKRAKGGSAILVGVEGTGDPSKPLNPEKIKAIKFLTVFERTELYPIEWYADPFAPKFGQPSVYMVQPRGVPGVTAGGQSVLIKTSARVHETRLIIFRGAVVSRDHTIREQGWGDGVLTAVWNVLRDWDSMWASTATLMSDYSSPIFKIKGLAEALAADRNDVLKNRISALVMARSILKAAIIDSEEDFSRDTAQLSGLAELLDKWCGRLAAAANMPLTMLMGQSPGGLNATGESDTRGYYDDISAEQGVTLRKPLERLIRLVLLSHEGPTDGEEPDDWKLKFNPLWQMSEKEKADIYAARMTADVAGITAGIFTAEEVAASRYSKPDSEIVIDFEGREQMAVEHDAAVQKHAAETAKAAEQAAKNPAPGAPPLGKPGAKQAAPKPPSFGA